MKEKSRNGKPNRYLIAGILFLAIAMGLILPPRLNILLFPTSEVECGGDFEFGGVLKEYVFLQEFHSKKDYIRAIDLILFSSIQQYRNDNTVLILDTGFRVLAQKRFTNEGLNAPKYVTFEFTDPVFTGRGNKVYLAVTSANGEKENCISMPKKKTSKLGSLTVRVLENNDVIGTLKGGKQIFPMEGSLCLRTYETNAPGMNWAKIFVSIIAIILSLLIIFWARVKALLQRITIAPEKSFVVLALFFGLILVFVTPPLQVPDENLHYYRSYQVSELHFFNYSGTVPSSLKQVADSVKRMNFGLFEKFRRSDREALYRIKSAPEKRIPMGTPEYIVPFLPQGIGMMAGRIAGVSPVSLIYFGRIGNLLVSVLLIFFAIQFIPFSKWLLFLLALMPMTLYQMASLSYDALTLGLTFFFTGLILKYSFENREQRLSDRELGSLFLVIFLLGLCKLPYALAGFLFLLLPVNRLGNIKRYIIIFIMFLAAAFSGSQLWTIRNMVRPDIQQAAIPTGILTNTNRGTGIPADKPPVEKEATPFDQTQANPLCDAAKQKAFILGNPMKYLSILFDNTFFKLRSFYTETFVGKLGWLIIPLPGWLINLYLLLLFLTALLASTGVFHFSLLNRLLMLAIFFAGVILIETAMYLYWSPVGQLYVEGVQGRYFIPLSPLLLLTLSNPWLLKWFSKPWVKPAGNSVGKGNMKKKPLNAVQPGIHGNESFPGQLARLFIVLFVIGSMGVSIYAILCQFYFILI